MSARPRGEPHPRAWCCTLQPPETLTHDPPTQLSPPEHAQSATQLEQSSPLPVSQMLSPQNGIP